MSELTVFERLVSIVEEIAKEYQHPMPTLLKEHRIVDDLGFSSLEVAVLTARLEIEFQCEPFSNGDVPITDIRTIGQVHHVYENVFNGRPADEGLFSSDTYLQPTKRRRRPLSKETENE